MELYKIREKKKSGGKFSTFLRAESAKNKAIFIKVKII